MQNKYAAIFRVRQRRNKRNNIYSKIGQLINIYINTWNLNTARDSIFLSRRNHNERRARTRIITKYKYGNALRHLTRRDDDATRRRAAQIIKISSGIIARIRFSVISYL